MRSLNTLYSVKVIDLSNPNYPPLLKEIHDPPKILHIRGNIEALNNPNLFAVVGSRKASTYAKQAMSKILPSAVESGVVLVSGLAYGVDSMAHQICVKQQRPTIAVLGSGVNDDTIYPKINVRLAHEIIKHGGAIISEYPAGTPPLKHRFPERNRIIAGLCRATLIIQASERSGSLITARLAMESNREVTAIPGQITDPLSRGTNKLIQEGATPILTTQDILNIFGLESDESHSLRPALTLTVKQERIYKNLSNQPKHIDLLAIDSKLPAHEISAILTELELAGHVQNVGSMKYTKK